MLFTLSSQELLIKGCVNWVCVNFGFFSTLEVSTRGLSNANQVLAVAKVHFTESIP